MKEALKVGDLEVKSGEKKYGRLKVACRADGSEIYIPLMIVNGSEDGPIFLVNSGCHGDEYEGGEAIRRAYKTLDPGKVKGSIIGVPVMNTTAFEASNRCSSFDNLNLNRVFPGKERGFFTERLAYVYHNEISKKADYIIDFHGGGNIQTLAHLAIWRNEGGENTVKRAYDLVRSTGTNLIWKGSGGWAGPMCVEAQKLEIPTVTVEMAGEGRAREEIIGKFEKMVYNVLRTYKLIDGEPELPEKVTIFEGSFISCINGGFYEQKVEVLEKVRKNDLLGTIRNPFGEIVEEIRASFDGIIASKRTFPSIEPGGWTLMIGEEKNA